MPRTRRSEQMAYAAANRRIEVFKMRTREGLSFPEIAAKLNLTLQTVIEDHKRILAEGSEYLPPQEREAAKNAERLKYDEQERRLLEILNRDHYVVSHGKLITDEDGNKLIDDGPHIAALRVWVSVCRSRALLEGLDAPTRVIDMTPEFVDAEIERRCRALGLDPERAVEAARSHLTLVLGEAG